MTENITRNVTQQLKGLICDSRRPAAADELMRVHGALSQTGVVTAAVIAHAHTFAVPHGVHTGSGHCIWQSTKTYGTASQASKTSLFKHPLSTWNTCGIVYADTSAANMNKSLSTQWLIRCRLQCGTVARARV